MNQANTYTCAHCHGTFMRLLTDAEAIAQYEKEFGGPVLNDVTIICDACFRMLTTGLEEVPA